MKEGGFKLNIIIDSKKRFDESEIKEKKKISKRREVRNVHGYDS